MKNIGALLCWCGICNTPSDIKMSFATVFEGHLLLDQLLNSQLVSLVCTKYN